MRFLILILLFPTACFGQLKIEIDAKATNTIVVSGLVNPVVSPDGTITADEESEPLVEPKSQKTLRVVTDAKFVDLTIERLVVVDGRVERQRPNVFSSSVANPFEYIVQGDGEYEVFVSAFGPGIQKAQATIQLSKPKPPEPPKPPDPPIPPIQNGYNVGSVALKTAPSDPVTANMIATWYRNGASQLYGKGRLNDIERIKADIDKQFSTKQCRDQATCQQWDKWKTAVSAAFVAEQVKRKVFTREDWFASMVEVAEALEAVR